MRLMSSLVFSKGSTEGASLLLPDEAGLDAVPSSSSEVSTRSMQEEVLEPGLAANVFFVAFLLAFVFLADESAFLARDLGDFAAGFFRLSGLERVLWIL